MTLSSDTYRTSYDGDGATAAFAVGFVYFDKDHVRVIHVDANGDETVWVRGTQYTLSGDGSAGTGQLDVDTSPTDYTPATGEKLVIRLYPPLLQEVGLPSGNYLDDIERADDIIVQIILRLYDDIVRSVKFGEGSASTGVTVPDLTTAGYALVVDGAGSGLEWVAPNTASYLSLPGSSTDNAVARFDGASGTSFQNSGVTIDDSDNLIANTVDVSDAGTTRTNLGLGSGDSPSFSGLTVAPTETYEQSTIKNFFEDDVWSTGCIRGGVPEVYDGTQQSVSSITRSGTTATATVTGHGYSNGDTINIAGADQSEYNGESAISNVATNTFDFTVSGSPASPATGTITAAWTTPIDPRGGFQLGRNIAAQAHGLFRLFRQSGTSTRPSSEKARIGLDANDNLALMAGANDTPALVVDSSGNVGIGGIDPSTLLHIETTDPTFRFKRSDAGTNAYGEITVDTSGFVQVKCDPGGAAGGSGFRIAVDGSAVVDINGSGDVLPGTTEAQDLGSVALEWDNIFLQNAATVSDERRKENIQDIDWAVDFLRLVEAKQFTLKDTVQPSRTRTVTRQKTQTVEEACREVELVDGLYRVVEKTRSVERPVFEYHPLHDENGNPVLDEKGVQAQHKVPVMETVEIAEPEHRVSHSRPHTGVIAQQVLSALRQAGVKDWAGVAYDAESDTYHIRYLEIIGVLIAGYQDIARRIEILEGGDQ